MIIKINALDTLFFRDGRPFSMGDETWANGVFPPYPSVFYGALRSAYFAQDPTGFRTVETEDDPTRDLKVLSIALLLKSSAGSSSVYYPLPLDCVKLKDDSTDKVKQLEIMKCDQVTSYPCEYFLVPSKDERVEQVNDGWVPNLSLEEYLTGVLAGTISITRLSKLVISEPKVGIKRNNNTRTTGKDEGMLYRVDMKRMETTISEVAFLVEFEDLDLPSKGFIRLGGEGKAAYYEEVKEADNYLPAERKILSGISTEIHFKIYLTTPAFFQNGWYPGWLKGTNSLSGGYNGLKVKLVAAAVGDYLTVGGFDMKKNAPKPMKRMVPAGSVYYFQILDGNHSDVITCFHKKAISDDPFYSKQGFGIALAGGGIQVEK